MPVHSTSRSSARRPPSFKYLPEPFRDDPPQLPLPHPRIAGIEEAPRVRGRQMHRQAAYPAVVGGADGRGVPDPARVSTVIPPVVAACESPARQRVGQRPPRARRLGRRVPDARGEPHRDLCRRAGAGRRRGPDRVSICWARPSRVARSADRGATPGRPAHTGRELRRAGPRGRGRYGDGTPPPNGDDAGQGRAQAVQLGGEARAVEAALPGGRRLHARGLGAGGPGVVEGGQVPRPPRAAAARSPGTRRRWPGRGPARRVFTEQGAVAREFPKHRERFCVMLRKAGAAPSEAWARSRGGLWVIAVRPVGRRILDDQLDRLHIPLPIVRSEL